LRVPTRQVISGRHARAARPSQRGRARCRAGIRSPRRRRPGWAGHDRALTVPGPVTRTTRGPWVAASSPRRSWRPMGSPPGDSAWLEGSPRREGPGGEPRRGGPRLRRPGAPGLRCAGPHRSAGGPSRPPARCERRRGRAGTRRRAARSLRGAGPAGYRSQGRACSDAGSGGTQARRGWPADRVP
jgi:hypothetical protein